MKFSTARDKLNQRPRRGTPGAPDRNLPVPNRVRGGQRPALPTTRSSAFTLAEVLVALMFMAIVVPVVVEALHVASLSGEIATRKAEASRVADSVLNESIVTTNWTSSLSGTVVEGAHEFRWTMSAEPWRADSAMQMVTAEVTFLARGRDYSVRLNTLATLPTIGATTMAQ